MNILLTGGAGYIGSHTCVELLNAGHQVVVFDNFSNSHPSVLSRVNQIAGRSATFVCGDTRNRADLERVLRDFSCEAVIHFAGLKALGESVERPLAYYDNNVIGTIYLLQAMQATGVRSLVFSSSATVYGEPEKLPLAEDHPLHATNPYGYTKLVIEQLLSDWHHANPDTSIVILRYFNPVGAHPSGLIGENPQGTPCNLFPYVAQVAIGLRERLNIWGDDYPTPDGTGVRDYIHVMDLARGHLCALEQLIKQQCTAVNLGTGRGYSVLEVVRAFEVASGRTIRCVGGPRRPGDVATCYADPMRARVLMGWEAENDLDTMCADHWHWQQMNPRGY